MPVPFSFPINACPSPSRSQRINACPSPFLTLLTFEICLVFSLQLDLITGNLVKQTLACQAKHPGGL